MDTLVFRLVTAFLTSTWFRLGGNGYPKLRKWGIPLILLIKHPDLNGVIAGLSLFIVTTLPITLRGDDVKKNLWWIPILGLLYGISLIPIGASVYSVLFVSFSYWFLIYMTTVEPYPWGWDWYEILFGFIYGMNI